MMNDPQCLFCRIATHEIPAEVVYEDEHTLAFLDIHPRAPGHAMVISKYHSSALSGLPEAEVSPLFLALQKVTDKIFSRLGADGLTIGINQGRVSGQEVDHLHIHVMPRFKGDGGGSIQSVVDNPSKESISEISNKVK